VNELNEELLCGFDAYSSINEGHIDLGYPNTNIDSDLIDIILDRLDPMFWLEVGSMIGGSAILTGQRITAKNKRANMVCIDPFTGDVNMWDWEKRLHNSGEWRFLRLENGEPTLRKRFLANVKNAGLSSRIFPLQCTSIVGIRLISRLYNQNRISMLPEVIYLDSAHEQGETFLEILAAWNLLSPGGVLFGDDWNWPAVRHDVTKFICSTKVELEIIKNHWVIWKSRY
jgi:predicted O-methyltransferase YrrM